MPTFDLTSPDGKTYSVEGPEGATPEQAFQILQQHLGSSVAASAAPDVGIGEDLAKTVIPSTGRMVAGVAGMPGDLSNLLAKGSQAATDYLAGKLGIDPGPRAAAPILPTSTDLEKRAEAVTGNYQPQTVPGQILDKAIQFAPGVIGGPETLATKLLTRVAAPAVASEAAGKLAEGTAAQPYAELAGALGGAALAPGAMSKLRSMTTARAATAAIPDVADLKAASRALYQHGDVKAVQIKPEVLSDLADKIENDLKYGENAGFRPANEKPVFDAINELRTPSMGGLPPRMEPAAAGPVLNAAVPSPAPAVAKAVVPPAAPGAQSLLEFIASKGGLGPDSELGAIGADGHTVNVNGVGRRKLVRQGGWPLDYAREAAEEAGYLRGGHNATSTTNDLLDAIDAEMRGQKRYPEGFEGQVTKREASAMGERERAEFDRHMQGLEEDLNAAGHGGLAPDVKKRVLDLMSKERIGPDDAVDRTLFHLEQEDSARAAGNAGATGGFPGDFKPIFARPQVAASARPATIADLDNVRQVLGNAAKERDAVGAPTRQAVAASRAIGHIDNFLPNLKQPDLLAGDAAKANAALTLARGNWGAAKRAEMVQTLAKNAEINAASANSGGNIQNATKQAFKPLLKNNYAKAGGYNDAEKAALNSIVRGTWTGSAARAAGNLLGGGGGLGMLAGGAAGYEAGGLPGAILAGAAGRGLKMIGNRSTFNAVQRLDQLIRSRAPEALKVAAQNPQLAAVLPSKSIRLLRTMILSEPMLRAMNNQMGQPVGQSSP